MPVITPVPSLESTIRANVHPEQLARIRIIDREDFSGVMQKAREHFQEIGRVFDEEYLQRGILALKQYYAVALLDPANPHAVSVPLDPFWHTHILFTESYMDFCAHIVGEYMHHRPLDCRNQGAVRGVRSLYDYTLSLLPVLFKDFDASFWPTANSDDDVICVHAGTEKLYQEVQPYRLFEPNPEFLAH